MIDSIFSIYQDRNHKWELIPLSVVTQEVKHLNQSMIENNLLSLSYGKIIRKDLLSADGLKPESYDGYNIVEKDDIVLRLTDLQNDKRSLRTGRVMERGIITSAYTSIRPTGIEPRWLAYTLHTYDLQKVFYSLGSGLRQSMNYSDLKSLAIARPPIEEQRKIANYLDAQISRIDDIVNAKIQQKRILNQEAQARLVEFFGHPHFSGLQNNEQRRLGPCLLLNEGGYWGEDPIGSNDTLVLRSTEITSRGKWRDLENGSYRNLNLDNNKQHLLRLDDIVVTKASGSLDHIGKAALVTQEIVDLGASFGNFMQRLRVNPSIYIPAYICHFLRSSNARSQFQYWGTTSTGLFNISAELLNNLQLPVVSLSEQERVSSIIEELEIDFEARLSLIEKSITLFEKLKDSTISEAVVGKLDSQTSKGASNV